MLSAFATEVWVKYSVAISIMALRFATRFKMVGWRNFDGTDLFCVIATMLYTMVSTCDYILSTPNYPTVIGFTQQDADNVTPDQVPLLERGSKIAHFSWTMYICMIFSFKGAILCFYKKIGMSIWERQVDFTAGFTILSWIASVLAHLCACVPVSKVWQIEPLPGPYCTTRPQNYYVAGVLNMLTDFIILILPMPMLWRLKINLRRKLALALLFGSGIFIIICTILRTYYSLSDAAEITIAQSWAGREGFVAMVVICAPGIWPLIRSTRLFASSYRDRYRYRSESNGGTGGNGGHGNSHGRRGSRLPWKPGGGGVAVATTTIGGGRPSEPGTPLDEMIPRRQSKSRGKRAGGDPFATTSTSLSEEHIMPASLLEEDDDAEEERRSGATNPDDLEDQVGRVPTRIAVTTEYSVEHEDAPPAPSSTSSKVALDWVN